MQRTLLKHHNFLTDCKIIAYHDTKNHKPHPEPYVKALNTIGGNHNNIFVFGDDEKDIKPALDLGFITIGVEWYIKYNGNI
jgi:HAD superfamily hydrolase (TIGR01509 family)